MQRSDNNKAGGQMQVALIAIGFLLAILSPIIAQLIQLAISRRREFFADASAVAMTKNPQGMINALERISEDSRPLKAANKATAHLYISNPLKNTSGVMSLFSGLFRTHPPIEERVKALQTMRVK